MKFINSVVAAVAVLLGACSFVPEKKGGVDEALVEPPVISEATESKADPEATNPYFANRRSVVRKAQQRFDSATKAMDEKNWLQVEEHLLWLVNEYPQYSGPLLNLAIVYRKTGKTAEAVEAYQNAIKVNPDNLDAYNELAILLREQGRFKEAEAQYLEALSVWPDYPQTHRNLGILYELYMGRLEDALHHYRRYQDLQTSPSPKVAGWIADLQRRVNHLVAETHYD